MKALLTLGMGAMAACVLAQTVTVEGKTVEFDAPPRMVGGVLMVPVRPLFEAMGAELRWKAERNVLEGLRSGSKVEMWVGSRMARRNDQRADLAQAPFVQNGQTYAPLEFLAEGLGYLISKENGMYVLRERR